MSTLSASEFLSSPACPPPQGKDDFERQQKELLDKENIIKQSQVQLGQEQVRQTLLHWGRSCSDCLPQCDSVI